MLKISAIHHVAIICSDYEQSKQFYTTVLGLKISAEHFRADRNSWKCDLMLGNGYVIELFSFPDAPQRLSHPEAAGLRHLAFEVADVDESVTALQHHDISCEQIRVDPYTGKRFTFFSDPDNLPIELYEA
jgi:glyoxylase I family protein